MTWNHNEQVRTGYVSKSPLLIGKHVLPDLLLRFADAYLKYRIESRMVYSRRIQTHLATSLSDLALREQASDHSDILVQKWLDDELVQVIQPTRSGAAA